MNRLKGHPCAVLLLALAVLLTPARLRAEAVLQLFNVNWEELSTKMPEIAEAGYTALWLPPPSKGGSVFSVGYDLFDPFDLGDKDQRGTVRTRYGTKAELLRMVEMAHRFGIRVYFDNIMNHRGFDVPRYNSSTPTNVYPGMTIGDFHVQEISGGFYRNWADIGDWNNTFEIQHNPLGGLLDIAHESPNANFGTYRGTTAKPVFIRHPNNPEYYMDGSLPAIAGGIRPFNGTNGTPVAEDVGAYLNRAIMWLVAETRCDGFRLDAVKHVPGYFFGDYNSASANGYLGAIQTMFDYVHGYGNNVTGNGYVEGDDNRNSNYDSEVTRNDALLFGEHLGEPPSYGDYLGRGMRLLDNPLRNNLNDVLGNPSASLAGYEQRDTGGFSAPNRVMHASSHDNGFANRRELQNAYYFFREGIPLVYSDGYNQESTCDGCGDPFPRIAYAAYLGQFGDNKLPNLATLHGDLARGGTRPRWGDSDVVAWERFDYREPGTDADKTVVLFAMNDNYGNPGDISFDDGVQQNDSGGIGGTCYPVVNTRGQGMVVGFPPGSILYQHADSPGDGRACFRVLVRKATNSKAEAENTKNAADPVERKVYVGSQTLASGGGAIEFKIPSGGYIAYAYQAPQPSKASQRDVITFRHGSDDVPRITVLRKDGRDGDHGFNPIYPFQKRGSIDQFGNVVGGSNVSARTYAIDIPVVTNAAFDILVRPDASADNVLVKLDGGIDLNRHMNMGSSNATDPRDNKPGAATDVFLGYEQALFRYRRGPEKFASTNIANNTVVSLGAETFRYASGSGNASQTVGSGGGAAVDTETADWVYHSPGQPVGGTNVSTQRFPISVNAGQSVDVWVKVGYQFRVNSGRLYYTTDGSDPEGSFGSGRDATKVLNMSFSHTQSEAGGVADWWKVTIPGQPSGTVKYKVGFYRDGIGPISDSNEDKRWGVTQFAITNFNPAAARVWLHNNRKTNDTRVGLEEGFHIVRARAFLPRSGKSSVSTTYAQTFYYDAFAPEGVIAFPAAGDTLRSQQYGAVIRADSTVTEVEYNILDSNPANDDTATGVNNGNGTNAWARATLVTPSAGLSAQYPNYPREFRFNYYAVPSSGNATITLRLKEATTAVLTNRVRVLSRTVATAAPAQTLAVAFPSSDGQTLSLAANENYTLVFRFSDTLAANVTNFLIRINDQPQPRYGATGAPLYFFQDQTAGDGKNELRYVWTGIVPGQHTVEVAFNGNGLALEATRIVNVTISGAVVNIVQPPAADNEGRSPYQIIVPARNGVPLVNSTKIITETTTAVTNVLISFSTNAFTGGAAVRDTNFIGNARRWEFAWNNLIQGTHSIRADAFGGGTNSATRVVQVVYAPVDQFRLIAPGKTGDIFQFSIQTLDGRTYVIQYTDDLANPVWHSLPNVNGDGTVKLITDTAPGVPQRYYRFRTL